MPDMRRGSVQCLTSGQLHRMAYTEWGRPDNPRVLICVHGLSRNGRDFDVLAAALSCDYRVLCPDIAGRGDSDWLVDKSAYAVPSYVPHLLSLIARLDVERVDWLGTSMGGLIGMALAAMPGNPIRRLILNDVGPVLSAVALTRIGDYVGRAPHFLALEEAERYLRGVCPGFGPLSDAQWRQLTLNSLRPEGNGWRMHYDPAIGDAMRAQPLKTDMLLWPMYDAITAPTLVLRGVDSDLLSHATAEAMTRRGPCARHVEIAANGHAPMLMDPAQIGIVREFLVD
ncbi:alpha/beta fold hydrolase [Uliginosibacterium sp. TH139]|uniref:alpha/beta fold hydrolase n=1 Tax=Uliginosibacterium sp. TH139 TaxID=2067453 RepID=UPI0020B1708F|nr:alpha/beta hydrolase [Uliginosibacterium sp. TH139]